MAEYIEREAAIAWFAEYEENDPHEYISPRHIMEDLSKIPAADVVEVVRCKDCKRWWRHTWGSGDFGRCKRYGSTMRFDDFCSYGERKDTE